MEVREQLLAPFAAEDIEWRVQRAGVGRDGEVWAMLAPYITARGVQERLDTVFGLGGWEVSYRPWEVGHPGVLCTLRVRDPETGMWVVREDGAEQPETEPVKGGFSNALKRAAVQFGIGRYLYGIGTVYADVSADKRDGYQRGEVRDKKTGETHRFYWAVPAWAMARVTAPGSAEANAPGAEPDSAPGNRNSPRDSSSAVSPACPRCAGPMWDNRANKRSPRAPDWRCKDKECGGVYWPGQAPGVPAVEDAEELAARSA
jgi:hypothetical protein